MTEPHHDDNGFMSAADLRNYMQELEMAKASKALDAMDKAAAARRELVEKLTKPVTVTPEMRANFQARLRRAAANGERELQVMRFPVELCTDRGRAINVNEPGWDATLTGVPRQFYELWRDHLRDAGYRLKALIVEWPNGMPGDIGLFVSWDDGAGH